MSQLNLINMLILKETTKSFPENLCHTYFVSDDKFSMFGYIPFGQTEPKMCDTPLRFNKKGRTFKTIKK